MKNLSRRLGLLCLGSILNATLAHAQQHPAASGEALQLLQKVATAAQKVTYSGVFIYQNGSRSETSRITHLIDGGNEFERLEVLDGSPREVMRRNDEVRCFLPESKMLIVEQRNTRPLFPTLLPGTLAGLTEYYHVRKGTIGRIAGIESQSLHMDPRDEFRYGHQFWIDPQTGLLLKASLLNENGQPLESFAFTELRYGIPQDVDAVKAKFDAKGGNWQVQQMRSSDVKGDDGQWLIKAVLPGFRRISGARRQLRPDAPEGMQLIFSDGLASISVFIEPDAGRGNEEARAFSMGAVNGYRRRIADHLVIVMGDVPPTALRRFADAIEPKRK
jgi:sigma-E factor negative regulatory protein RseB